jgi:hypothetical protein
MPFCTYDDVVEYTIPVPSGSDAGVLDAGVLGGAGGIRTRYLFNAIEALSRVSYSPI